MGRALRTDARDCVYHVLNRANAKTQIFETKDEYQQFEEILEEAVHKFNMRLLAYCNQRFLTPLIPLTASQVSEFVLMI